MKKFIKLVLPIVLILAVVLSFGACSSGKEDTAETPENSMAEEMKNDGADEIEEQSGEQLSASCDYILAQATDSKGNLLELVANDSETYDGSQTIGLIKNNKWVIEMTDDSPIIDENGLVYGFKYFTEFYIADVKEILRGDVYNLVSDNCFVLSYDKDHNCIFWNFKTGKIYKNTVSEFVKSRSDTLDENLILIRQDNNMEYRYELFDTETLEVVKIFEESYYNIVNVYSEGLFFAKRIIDRYNSDGSYEKEIIYGFYDAEGNLVIDLSKYGNIFYEYEPVRFIDGKSKFMVANASGKEFEITIDKQGNVLSETAV